MIHLYYLLMRQPLIAANWKMHFTLSEAGERLERFLPQVRDVTGVEIVIAGPFTVLAFLSKQLEGSNVLLAAQNVFFEEKGAYTGEISPLMLADLGCTYVILGHSERRQYFGLTDESVNRRIKASLSAGLKVILCIGETLELREAGKTNKVLETQLSGGLEGVELNDSIVIAYEPVWAIGTGRTATPEQAQEAHEFIRARLRTTYGGKAEETRILYGGSVKPDNVDQLMACADVDGALVGGASLTPDSFARLVKFKR
jgi:triosephosphate isomerase